MSQASSMDLSVMILKSKSLQQLCAVYYCISTTYLYLHIYTAYQYTAIQQQHKTQS